MKPSILAAVVAASIFSGSAFANESFSIMNDRLSSAIQDNANNHNATTQKRVADAYNGARSAIGGSMDNSRASAVDSSSSASVDEDRISQQITSTIGRQGEVRQYQSGFMSSVSKATEEANTPAGVSSEVVHNKDSLNAPLNTTINASTDIANPSQIKNTPVANTASATVDVASNSATANTPVDGTYHAALVVDRTPQQVASNAARQGEVRQAMDTRISSVSKAPAKANTPAGVSTEVIHEKSSLNAPVNTQTHVSVEVANPSQVRSTPVANSSFTTTDVASNSATANTPVDGTYHAALVVDRTPQQVASNAARQGEVRQAMDTRISSVSNTPEKANTPAGVSREVVHQQSTLNAPVKTQTHVSVEVANPTPVRNTPINGTYHAAVSNMQTETMNISADSLSPDTKVATPEGKVVSAGSLPANTQVAMPFTSAFSRPQHSGNNRSGERGDHHGGGTGNGANNAQNSRSAGGLADSHVGGGREGGGFHY